ncbi:MAG: pyridoxal phosphate-dependent aminotransferase [Deltaproteobacteria bacterium]|nr:pyridoxal phosphate-dependent aminotransferase [Deltaproteobacteria bacterium]
MELARRVRHLRAEGAYVVLARAQELEAAGRSIVHFEIGQPDFTPPANVTLAGIRAIADGYVRYNPPAGIQQLRAAIAEEVRRRNGLPVRPEQVVVGPGLKPNLFFAAAALVEPGDEVIYPDPGFPSYEALPAYLGAVGVPVALAEVRGFSLDLEAFHRAIGPRTRLVILNSPSNPTGGVIPRQDLEQIAAAARRHDFWVMSDEIYARLVYDGCPVPSIATLPGMAERTIVLDGFSKTHAMSGWRLGYAVMPVELASVVQLQLMHVVGCTAHFTQYAGVEALQGPQDEVEQRLHEYRRRRDLLVEGLSAIPGIRCPRPAGAFYVFPNTQGLGRSSAELATYFLEEAGVALLPGTSFGSNGEGYLRLSYCTSLDNIREGIARMRDAVRRLAG